MMTTCHTTTLTAVRDQRHGRLVGLVDNEIDRFLEGFSSASPIESLTNEAVALSLLILDYLDTAGDGVTWNAGYQGGNHCTG